jgi:hypothetical protein
MPQSRCSIGVFGEAFWKVESPPPVASAPPPESCTAQRQQYHDLNIPPSMQPSNFQFNAASTANLMAEIGAIASIVGVAGAGAKLSLVLFEFASTVGSARVEVERVGTEISQFCAVLTQLRSTLKKARARRFSLSAISTTQDILERCQKIFKEIEDIVAPLQRNTGNSKESSVDLVARVKWTFKRSKVQVLQKTLESSKNSLQLMLQVLDLAQKTATPRQVDLTLLLATCINYNQSIYYRHHSRR